MPAKPLPAAAAPAKPVGKPEESFVEFGCSTCHSLTDPSRKLGPSLMGVGKRIGKLNHSASEY